MPAEPAILSLNCLRLIWRMEVKFVFYRAVAAQQLSQGVHSLPAVMDSMHHLSTSSNLTQAADGLLASLQRAQAELEAIHQKLEQEFSQRYKGTAVNPYSLLTRINKLCRDMPQLQVDCKEVLAAKQEVVDAAKQQLMGNVELLHSLQRKAGIPAKAGGEVEASFLGALAEHEAKLRAQHAGDFESQFNRQELNQAYVDSMVV